MDKVKERFVEKFGRTEYKGLTLSENAVHALGNDIEQIKEIIDDLEGKTYIKARIAGKDEAGISMKEKVKVAPEKGQETLLNPGYLIDAFDVLGLQYNIDNVKVPKESGPVMIGDGGPIIALAPIRPLDMEIKEIEESKELREVVGIDELMELDGIGETRAKNLIRGGILSLEKIVETRDISRRRELTEIDGIGEKTAHKIWVQAKEKLET